MIKFKNEKINNIIKNSSFTISSNLLGFLISTVVILVLPRYIGVDNYGYWQLYILYSSFAFFFHFGWNDGIYLKHGGDKYNKLNKRLFFSQFYMLLTLQLVIAIILFVITNIYIDDNKAFVFKMTALNMIIVNMRYMLLFILQATNRIKEYSLITIIDRLLYFIFIILFLFGGFQNFELIIISDLFGKTISLLLAIYFCKDIVFQKISSFYFDIGKAIQYIHIGIKLMFANIANRLIIGIVKFGIEFSWGIATFGKVALTLSISNLMMTFVSAVGMVMFPILRRVKKERLNRIYISIREPLMILLLGSLIFYFPLNYILIILLPEYQEGLVYMALLFPIFTYEGRMSLLINTYLKTLREEKKIMGINIFILLISVLATIISTAILKNLQLAVLSITILIILRCLIAEIILAKIIKVPIYKNIIFELIVTITFITIAWYSNTWTGATLFFIVYILYIVLKRKDIIKSIEKLKSYF